MKRRILILAALASACWAQTPGIDGPWQGTLDTGSVKLRLALKVKKAADGALSATMDSLDQGAMDIPIAAVTFKDGALNLDVQAVRGTYEAKLSADGSQLSGTWSQGGGSLPLSFKRGDATPMVMKKGRALTGNERDYLIGQFERTRKLFLDSIAGLNEAQWKFKAAPERWSIAECAEHITLTEDFLFNIATQQIMKIPPSADRRPPTREDDEKIFAAITDRSRKAQAPEPLSPKQTFSTREAVVAEFNKRRTRNVDYVRGTEDDLREHASPNPAFGTLDAYQFLVLMAAHSQRHTAQIDEVKTAAGYPK